MKKVLISLAMLLGLVACQNDFQSVDVDVNGEAALTLTVGLPADATRAAGVNSAEGALTNINLAEYDVRFILEVYDAAGNLAKERITNYEDDATTTVFDLRLVPGREYNFVAWADFVKEDQTGDYHYNTSTTDGLKNVEVNTATWNAMDESRDAYTGVKNIENFTSASAINFELTRPFAKLRVVTTDIKELYGDLLPEDVTVKYNTKLYTAYNALTKEASAEEYPSDKVVKLSEKAYSNETPKSTGVMTLFADYMLADVEASPIQFTMDIVDNKGGVIPTIVFNTSIPIQRNHLTTVTGPILTDSNNVTVTINDAFDVPAEEVEVWDGKSSSEPKHNGTTIQDATEIYVEKGSELAWLADQVNGTTRAAANNFAGKTIMLTKDVNLGGNHWTPIGPNADSSNKFSGIFDGQGHKIVNLVVDTEDGYTAAGLFGALNGTAKNFTIENANIKHISTGDATDNGIAVVAGSIYNKGAIENVTVKNAVVEGNRYVGGIAGYVYGNIKNCVVDGIEITVTPNKIANGYDNGDKAGAIAGYFSDASVYYVSGNTAKNFTVQAYRDLGGIVGCANNGAYVKDNVAENGTLIVNQKTNYYGEKDANAGYIVGRIVNGSLGTGNDANNVSVGKFIGAQKAFDAARALEQDNVVVELTADVTLTGTTGKNFAKANTITVDGQGHKLTYTDSYRTYVEMADGGKVIYKNLKLYRETTGGAHWHDNNMKFCCDAEFYNVEFNKGICFDDAKTFVLNNSTISKNKVSTYALFITAGCNVSIDGLTVTHAEGVNGRGIKIVDEDVADKTAKTTLSVANSKFTTVEKAAIMVGSQGGATITLADNDITEVKADTVNTVWVDSDYKDYANNVTVSGGSMTIEGVEATESEGYADAVKVENATVVLEEGTYAALANVANGVTIFGNGSVIEGSSKIAGENVTIKNVTFTNPNGDNCFYYADFKSTTFEGCTFDGYEAIRWGKAFGDVVFTDCTFGDGDNLRGIHIDSGDGNMIFNDCTFYGFQAIGAAIDNITFNRCKFYKGCGSSVVNMYSSIYEYNDCSFEAGFFCDAASDNVTAAFNHCTYMNDSSIYNIVRFDKDPATCTISFDGYQRITDGVYSKANEYLIINVNGLKWLATTVNEGTSFSGKNVTLCADIDLNNEEWAPIGNSTNKFQGTFDGQNHKISNLVVTGNNSYVGLFGFTTNGEIKNLTVENAKVSGYLGVGVVAGSPYTSKFTNIAVTGHVEVNGFAYVGGVGGRNAYANWTNVTVDVDDSSYVNANSVENDGTAYRTYVGGVCGFNGEDGHTFTNITSNIDVKGSTIDVGGLFGIAHYNNKFVNCSCSGNVEIYNASEAGDVEEMGGIAGVWHNQNGTTVTFENCSFTGSLKANIVTGVDLSDNTIVGAAYSTSGTGELIIK